MQLRQIGTTEIEASAVALGTWVMGGWMWGDCDDSLAERAIQTSLDAGINMIDTAPIYSGVLKKRLDALFADANATQS